MVPAMTSLELRNCSHYIRSDLFTPFPNLKELHIVGNALHIYDNNIFSVLPKLTLLDLSWNNLEYLDEDTLEQFSGLHVLNLSHNNLQEIHPYSFKNLRDITEIDLSYNKISYLHPVSFVNLTDLRVLRLDWNSLVTLHEELFTSAPGLEQVGLRGNPLHCNCGLQWLVDHLRRSDHLFLGTETLLCDSNGTRVALGEMALECMPPVILHDISDQHLNILNQRILDCKAIGNPPPSIYWQTPHGIIADPGHRPWITPDVVHYGSSHQFIALPLRQDTQIYVLPNGSLVFQHFRLYFAGEYTCVAENPAGVATVSFNVSITSPLKGNVNFSLVIGGINAAIFLVIGIIIGLIRLCCDKIRGKKANRPDSILTVSESEYYSEESPDYSQEYDWYFANLDYSRNTPWPSPKKCATPAEEEDAEKRFLESGARIMGTLVDARERLRNNMERQVVRIRSGARHIKDSSHKAMETIRESSNKTVQTLRDTSNKTVQSLRDTSHHAVQVVRDSSHHAAARVRTGVVMGVEQVKYHVQSMKEFCGTGDLGQTISTVTVATNVDSQETCEIVKSHTIVWRLPSL